MKQVDALPSKKDLAKVATPIKREPHRTFVKCERASTGGGIRRSEIQAQYRHTNTNQVKAIKLHVGSHWNIPTSVATAKTSLTVDAGTAIRKKYVVH